MGTVQGRVLCEDDNFAADVALRATAAAVAWELMAQVKVPVLVEWGNPELCTSLTWCCVKWSRKHANEPGKQTGGSTLNMDDGKQHSACNDSKNGRTLLYMYSLSHSVFIYHTAFSGGQCN